MNNAPDMIIVTGRVTRSDDPLFQRGNDRIRKLIPATEYANTFRRWRSMGRTIDKVIPVEDD